MCNLFKKRKSYLVNIKSVIVHEIVFLTLDVEFSLLNFKLLKYLNVSYAAEYSEITKVEHFICKICLINDSLS